MFEIELIEKQNEVNKALAFINEKLEKAPAEKLRVRKHRDTVQFYITRKDSKLKKTETKYVKRKEEARIVSLLNKYYLEKLQNELEKEKILLNFQSGLEMQDKGEIYDRLPALVKKEIKPLFTSVKYNIEKWYKTSYKSNPFVFNQAGEYVTDLGEQVRSRAECLLANALNKMGLKYHYEELLVLKNGQKRYPDFKVAHPKTGVFYYIEFFGMMDDPEYSVNALGRIAEYAADPVFPQMIYIFDHKDVGFSNVSVNNILKTVFLT